MNGFRPIMKKLIVLSLLLLWTIVNSGTAFAATESNVSAPQTLRSYTRALVATALEKVALARSANHEKKQAETTAALNEVRLLFDLIRASRPTAEVKALMNYIKNHLGFEDNKQVLADLLPVYTALNAMTPSPVVNAARRHLDIVKQGLENSDRQKASQALKQMSQALVSDNVDIPLNAADQDLNNAINTLVVQGKPAHDETLLSIEKNLLVMLDTLHNTSVR